MTLALRGARRVRSVGVQTVKGRDDTTAVDGFIRIREPAAAK
jgi:hypothetical protein